MQALLVQNQLLFLRRRDESSGGGMGCFVVLVIVGIIVFLILRGFKDRQEQLGASKRPMGSGPVEGQTFANPFPKCSTCGAAGDKMKQQWDGLRKVTWTCSYCGSVAGVQELTDEELPLSARQRLGLDQPQGMLPGQSGYYPQDQGGLGGVGGLLTGMMIGNMLGGSGHGGHHGGGDQDGGWGGDGGASSSGGDWGGDASDSGGDWGDSGGDFGGDL